MADLTVQESVFRKTGSATLGTPLTVSTTNAFDWELRQVLVRLSTNANVTVTLTFNSLDGTNYDTLLVTESGSARDVVFSPSELGFIFAAGDEADVMVSVPGGGGGGVTAYVTILGVQR